MDKMREEFEAWFSVHKPKYDGIDYKVVKQQHWNAWKASRAALVVELPDHVNDMDSAPMLYDSIVEQLNALGVRYE